MIPTRIGAPANLEARPDAPGAGESNLDRRDFLAGAGAAAALVAFDRAGGRWLTAAEARGVADAHPVPDLDGELRFDLASRSGSATDMGKIERALPWAVLLPGSVSDIQKMILYCREHGIKVAQRGQHHSMHGQSLSPGLVIERGVLRTIHALTPTSITVDAGLTFKEILQQTLPQGLRTRVIPGYAGLSIGGQLSVGGCPMQGQLGGTVDSVRALQVVTGAGEIVDCSQTQNVDLFEAMLGGLGQCGVITRVTLDMVPAKAMVRTWLLTYADAGAFFADFRALHARGEVDEVYNVSMPPISPRSLFQLNVAVYFEPGEDPDAAHFLRDLTYPAALAPEQDRTYYDWATFVDSQVEVLNATVQWEKLAKPWYDVWLPDAAAQEHVTEVLSQLGPDDVGAGGFILIFPHKRSAMTRPFYRVPDGGSDDRIFLFDVATTSMTPTRDPSFAQRKIERNARWFAKAKALGGTRYPIGALDFDQAAWQEHFGESWPEFARRKALYDPDNIMTPGPGIF